MAGITEYDLKEHGKSYISGNLKAFLRGKKTINWLIGTFRTAIQSFPLSSQDLEDVFDQYKDYGDQERWQESYVECQDQGWL